ncbi:MAG: ABC transporter permease [Gemmatimonadota bacterium]|jgi:predicted permease
MTGFGQATRHALRSVARDKKFYAFAALIIGLGVGANTAVFSVMNPLLFRPLPFENPEELAWISLSERGGMSSRTSRASNLRDFRALNESFDGLTGYFAFFEYESYNLVGEGDPERLVGVGVAQDFLDVLGVAPHLGRNFVEEEGVWGGRAAAILTHGFWRRRFGADPAIVGRSITLNDVPTEVVGVLPASFDFASTFSPASRVDFLRPFPISDETDQWGNTLFMIGRLRPGATVESAQAELDLIVNQLQEADPGRWGLGAVVSGLQDHISGGFRSALFLLAAAAGFVMLIACANLSNLLLARGPKRQKEMAIRSALGASRNRLLGQLLLESLILGIIGGAVGVLIAYGITGAISGTTAVRIPMLHAVTIDGTVLLFTLVVALGAGALIGIMPAFQVSAGQEASAMRDSSRGSSQGRRQAWLREALVVGEVATACILLVGGGLLMKSFARVLDVELGYEPRGVTAWRVDTNRSFETMAASLAFYDQLVTGVEALPGVEAAGLSDCLPLGRNRSWGIRVQGVAYEEGSYPPSSFPRIVDHRYLPAMEIDLLEGRYFTLDDISEEAPPVIIINETGARILFEGEPALGRVLLTGPGDGWEVVGVVADTRHQSLEEDPGIEMYLPMGQLNWPTLEMVVRSRLPVETLIGPVRAAMSRTDPTMPTGDFRTLDSMVDRSVSPRRFTLLLLGGFAGTALLLAALGIYGVLSYTVTQRVPEIGIRMAMGESGAQVLGRVVARTMVLAGVGAVVGIAAALALSRLMASLLYGVEATDPLTFLYMTAVLLMVAVLAGYLPARRASRTDPMIALRVE